jgi:hypothetical protein
MTKLQMLRKKQNDQWAIYIKAKANEAAVTIKAWNELDKIGAEIRKVKEQDNADVKNH